MNSFASTLGLGCWAFGGDYWKEQSHRESVATIRKALEEGIDHFDTAGAYGNGRSEQIVGQQLKRVRDGVTIATKGLYHPPEDMEAGIEKSLRRLLTDRIDIYYIHWPKPGVDLRPMMEALEKARAKGLIRHIGVSNFSPEQISPLLEAGNIDYCQFGYSLIWRVAEKSLIPFCGHKNIRMVTYGSLGEGLLAGENRLPSNLSDEDPRKKLVFSEPGVIERVERVLMEIFKIAQEMGITPAQLALMWNLSRHWADTVLFGARNQRQLKENLHVQDRFHESGIGASVEGRLDELTGDLIRMFPDDENVFGHRPR
ncbi:MAG: aldo/keto reductase [Spirochaetaceae bacterium]